MRIATVVGDAENRKVPTVVGDMHHFVYDV